MQEATDAVLSWMDENPEAAVEDLEAKLHELEDTVGPLMAKLRSKGESSADAGGSKFYDEN